MYKDWSMVLWRQGEISNQTGTNISRNSHTILLKAAGEKLTLATRYPEIATGEKL